MKKRRPTRIWLVYTHAVYQPFEQEAVSARQAAFLVYRRLGVQDISCSQAMDNWTVTSKKKGESR